MTESVANVFPLVTRMTHRILAFYSGAGADHRGRHLREILEWSDDELERVHDYIQWLFPLPERSGFNVNAPTLDEQSIQAFQSRADLQQNLRASFIRMLAFYGLEVVVESCRPTVRRAPSFTKRSENWLRAGNHNHLRITRILKSLRILALEREALAFFELLADIYNLEMGKSSPRISDETFRFWKSAAF
jgi:Opioid growth factor receptor (OGFr) conserved region